MHEFAPRHLISLTHLVVLVQQLEGLLEVDSGLVAPVQQAEHPSPRDVDGALVLEVVALRQVEVRESL